MAKGNQGFALRNLDTLFNVGAVGGLTDAQLLELFTSRRDEAAELAFAVLIDRHGPMVLRVCQAVLRDSHDAHDAFQATFLVLVQKARGLWVSESLGPWLHQVAHRTSSYARSARARRRRHERLAASSSAELAAGEFLDDLGEVLHEELGRLPQRYRAAVVLCLLEGLTPEQAARHLGWPVGTVHSRLARGRERLRCRLTRRGLAPGIVGTGSLPTAKPAAVPAALLSATKTAATRFAAGAMADGMVSASVVALTKEGLRTRMVTKLMMAAGATLALGIAVTAAGALPLFRAGVTPQGSGKPDTIQAEPPMPIIKEQAEPDGRVFSLAISPDGKTLAAGCTDSSVRLLDARTGEKRVALAGVPRGYTRGLGFTPDGKTIAGVSDDNQLRLWEAASGKLMKALPALGDMERVGLPPLSPNSLAISPDGGLIAIGGSGSTDRAVTRLDDTTFFEVRVLNVKSGELVWSHLGRRGYIEQLAFSPDGKILASATTLEVKLWDARAGDLKQTLKPRSGTVWTLAFSADNRLLAGYGNAHVEGKRASWLTLWDVRSGAIVHSIAAGQASAATAPGTLAFSPDGKSLASAGVVTKEGRISIGGRDVGLGTKLINHIKLWDVATGALVWTSAEGDYGNVTSLVFSPDGGSLFCCDSTATTRIDARTGQTRQDLMRATEGRPRYSRPLE
jgi:RNA polymerase sigma factor (sigma-70 family)